MKHTLFYLMTFSVLVSCQSEKMGDTKLIRFDNAWSSPYKVSPEYCHQPENEDGKFLYILNKTEWAYFACEYPEKVIANVKKHGANLIRVCMEGTPYQKELNYDLWPWQGSRRSPDYTNFNLTYWDEVEKLIRLAGENGIGIDLVLYFTLKPDVKEILFQICTNYTLLQVA